MEKEEIIEFKRKIKKIQNKCRHPKYENIGTIDIDDKEYIGIICALCHKVRYLIFPESRWYPHAKKF